MSIGQHTARQTADEEARAEVDVLNSRLEQTSHLTKKIQASLDRLETSGKSVRDVTKPLSGETRRLQTLTSNIDAVLAAIDRLRQPGERQTDEERIIRSGPDKSGLSNYLASLRKLNNSLDNMQASNLRANQQAMTDLGRLIKSGNSQLENHFDRLLRGETPRSIEPLHYVTKAKPFPLLSQDKVTRFGVISAYASGSPGMAVGNAYVEVRSLYLSDSLSNLAAASINTAKKKEPDAIYRPGTNGVGIYVRAVEGLFLAEYDNICNIFSRSDWGPIFLSTCEPALTELARTLRELNAHIKANLGTDCYLAYEITELVSAASGRLETRTGELKAALAAAVRPIRETAKSSLVEMIDETRRKALSLQALPNDGAPLPIVSEVMERLQAMVEFLRPISSIMLSLGDGGWKSSSFSSTRDVDAIPSLASFDIGADGKEIFAHYCADTIDGLLLALEQRARAVLKSKPVIGVFIANSLVIVERMIRDSDLRSLLESRMGLLDQWRKKTTSLYTDACKDVSIHLLDAIHTNRSQRPTSGQPDSASIMKGLTSKDKENIKAKFQAFNSSFDDLVTRHKSLTMDREVRQMFARDIRQILEPLYNRFWDRYHEIDKGKGKYVRYDKSSIAAVFLTLYG